MTDAERENLARAYDELGELAHRECYGDPPMGEEHRCSCESCIATRVREQIRAAVDPAHVSLQENRLTSPPERVFLEVWRKRNERSPGLNDGFTTLEWILCPGGQTQPELVSHRDAQVAASVVQWLGTNCGQAYIWECEKRIKELDVNFRGLRPLDVCFTGHFNDPPAGVLSGLFEEAAAYIAGNFFPITHRQYPHLRQAILRALKAAEKRAETALQVAGAGI